MRDDQIVLPDYIYCICDNCGQTIKAQHTIKFSITTRYINNTMSGIEEIEKRLCIECTKKMVNEIKETVNNKKRPQLTVNDEDIFK